MIVSDSKTAFARMSAQVLIERYGIESPEEIDLEAIAHAQKVTIKSGPLKDVEAWLLRNGDRGIIRVRDNIRENGRRRFAIAHELGHFECHANQSQIWLCSSEDVHSYLGSTAELEANAFAGELLMPKKMLKERIAGRQVSVKLLCDLASEFDTTLTATALKVIGEVKEDHCVVFSKDDRVRWWRPTTSGFNFWLDKNFEIDIHSMAFDCIKQPSETKGPRRVDAEVWGVKRRNVEIWEESVLLGDYGIVMTLLSFA